MEPRRLGKQGLTVSPMELGCMGMSDAYGPADETEGRRSTDGRPEHVRDACDSSLEGDQTMFETTSHREVFADSTSTGAESAAVTETLPAHGQHPASKRGEQPATTS